MKNIRKLSEYGVVFGAGAIIYSTIEIIFRGFTHWTMTLTGGVALVCMYFADIKMRACKMTTRCFACCGIITVLEFIAGCIVNLKLGMNVWSYAGRRFNILGQICPLFSFFWLLLSIPALLLCAFIRERLGRERKLRQHR